MSCTTASQPRMPSVSAATSRGSHTTAPSILPAARACGRGFHSVLTLLLGAKSCMSARPVYPVAPATKAVGMAGNVLRVVRLAVRHRGAELVGVRLAVAVGAAVAIAVWRRDRDRRRHRRLAQRHD